MTVLSIRSFYRAFFQIFVFFVLLANLAHADMAKLASSDVFSTKVHLERIYTKNLEEDVKNIKALGGMHAQYEEVLFELIRRIRYEVQSNTSKLTEARADLILTTIDSLFRLTGSYEVNPTYSFKYEGPNERLINEINYTIYDYDKNFGNDKENAGYTLYSLFHLRTAIANFENALPSLVQKLSSFSYEEYKNHNIFAPSTPKLINREAESQKEFFIPNIVYHSMYREIDIEGYKEEIQRFETELNKRVIEQPEVVEYLTEMLKRDYLHKRERPEVFMTMGLPGGGKDTIAENFISTLFRDSSSWEDHIYRFSIIRSESDLWGELGSATGYIGSDKFPPFLKWCVEHSGGKYQLIATKDARGQEVFKVIQNPNWSGKNLAGFIPPERAVLFINEFHDWSRYVKNSFLKQLLEKGVVPINNPNGGVNHMRLNFNIQVASNDGIGLLADRHIDGRPRGKRQSHQEVLQRWEAVHHNDTLLRAEIMKSGVSGIGDKDSKGTSEEVANRMRNIFLLRPLSPEGLQKISHIFLNKLKNRYAELNSSIGKIKLEWSDKVVEFIQSYSYVAEENARPIENKVTELIQKTIDKAIFSGEIETDKEYKKLLKLDVIEKEDGTFELESKIKGKNEDTILSLPIKGTQKTKYKQPLTKTQVEDLMNLPERIKEQVFGVDHVIDKLSEAILKSEVHRNVNLERVDAKLPAANVFGFFGLSSTGKTETTKVLAEVLTGSKDNIWTISGNQIQSRQDWSEHFGYDQENPDKSSKFQKEFDRRNGRLIVVLDEISNSHLEGVKILYDYFREGEVGGRKMANVTFILTGNAGQEWYEGIPSHVPESERHFLMLDIYKQAISNTRKQEVLLMKYFPEALVKRIGMDRVFFFPPLNFKSIRQMFMLKVKQSFNAFFAENKETHWYNVKFKSAEEALKAIELFEKQGFRLDGQGASVDQYVNDKLTWPLKQLLIKNHVQIGAKVLLSVNESKNESSELSDKAKNRIELNIEVENLSQPLKLLITGKKVSKATKEANLDKVMTAYHEAGHSLVREILLGDKFKSTGISIIPGVADFGTQWIYYLGIARSEAVESLTYTKEAVLRQMAVLHGGWVAQVLVSKNETHDAGKSNDMERATKIAQDSILRYGLSEKFGKVSIPSSMSTTEYVSSMSAETRKLYESEVSHWIKESEELAKDALLINYKQLIELGKTLSDVGDMRAQAMREFYESVSKDMILEWSEHERFSKLAEYIRNNKYMRSEVGHVRYWPELSIFEKLKYKYIHTSKVLHRNNINTRENKTYNKRDAEIRHESLMPKSVANIEDLIEKHIQESKKDVELIRDFPVDKGVESAITSFFSTPTVSMAQCKALFN